MNSMLLRQASVIEDLLYLYKNMLTVEEEIAYYNYIFKQLLLVHEGQESKIGSKSTSSGSSRRTKSSSRERVQGKSQRREG